MCGFCGFTGEISNSQTILSNMMNKIIHRGPDDEGTYFNSDVCFGFRRLSIIGLENGTQPMFNEDGNIVIVFNGEIYNYKSLKEQLTANGHIFKTSADTEVLIHGYEQYGVDLLKLLRGMFSFVLWDNNKKILFGARDFFGIKPFYYTILNDNLIFASEIKSILEYPLYKKTVNHDALENYLTFQYSVLDETFFKGIYKLQPAHYFIFEDNSLDLKRYWQPAFKEEAMSLDEAVDMVDDVMQNSIKTHMISDVEVGSFLSSGVDSSYVAACFNGDKTFTVGFDYEKYNEIDYAKALSDKVNIANFSKMISISEYWNTIAKVQYHMDEPLADPSAVALYFVSSIASEHVKVVLSGEGADELFGGYNIYKEPMDLHAFSKLPVFIRKCLAKIALTIPFDFKGKNFLIRASKTVEQRFIGNANIFSKKEREQILKYPSQNALEPTDITKHFYDKVSECDDVTKMQYLDIHLWMVGDILLKADKMSMAHSLEVRVPFLDREVCDIATKIPVALRVNKQNTKFSMRMAANRHLPDFVANKKKLGFPVPIRIWLRDSKYYDKVKAAFSSDIAEKYFNRGEIIKLLDEHAKGKKDNSRKIWTIYVFLVWYEQFFL